MAKKADDQKKVDEGTETEDPKSTEAEGDDLQAELDKWKSLARQNEKRAKDNADAAERLAELEEADKSDSQKASDRATAAEKRADAAEARALRLEVAQNKGLTTGQAKRLVGTTQEELEADADDLLSSFSETKDDGKKGPTESKPKSDLKASNDDDDDDEIDADALAEKIKRRGL